jgi:hypothetical protein
MVDRLFIIVLLAIALAGMAAGVTLAVAGYSSAGPFAVSSACVGVLGTLATERQRFGGLNGSVEGRRDTEGREERRES